MISKNIIFASPGEARLMEEETRELNEDDVLVKLAVSTISSGTERANLVGEPNVSPYAKPTQAVFPRRSGYSSSGVIIKTGKKVGKFSEGDRVALYWSSHSQYCVINENNVILLPQNLSFEEGALLHIAAFPLCAIRKCRLEMGESAMVMGQGVLGQIAVKLLRAAGAAPIIAVDPNAEKRERARALGADYAFDPFAEDFVEKVKAVSGGVNVAIEVTGKGDALNQTLDCMKKFGRVALLGCTRSSDFTIDYYRKVHGPGITLIGAHTMARPEKESCSGMWTTRDDMLAVARMTSLKRMTLVDVAEEIHSPEEAPEVYARLATSGVFPVVQFDWSRLK